jgi:hypothetical protein
VGQDPEATLNLDTHARRPTRTQRSRPESTQLTSFDEACLLFLVVDRNLAVSFDITDDHRGPNPFILYYQGPNSRNRSITSQS